MTDPEKLETIIFERRGRGAWITLARPDKLNVFDPQMIDEVDRTLGLIEADPELVSVVITGAGRAFCVGGDLSFVDRAMGKGARDPRTVFLERLSAVLSRLETFPKPVIAAVNGMALAGGLEIVACADIVIACEKARLGDVHANYGLLPGGGNSQRLPRKLGLNLAKYLLFTGEMLAPERFVACGFVHEVVAPEQLIPRVEALVEGLARKSPLMLARTKQVVHDGYEQPLASALRLELAVGEAHAHSADMREGVSAFLEKRAPRFRGC